MVTLPTYLARQHVVVRIKGIWKQAVQEILASIFSSYLAVIYSKYIGQNYIYEVMVTVTAIIITNKF